MGTSYGMIPIKGKGEMTTFFIKNQLPPKEKVASSEENAEVQVASEEKIETAPVEGSDEA